MKRPINLTPILYAVVLVLIFTFVLSFFVGKTDDMTYSEIITQFEKENVKSFVVEENTMLHTVVNETTGESFQAVALPPFIEKIVEHNGLLPYLKARMDANM